MSVSDRKVAICLALAEHVAVTAFKRAVTHRRPTDGEGPCTRRSMALDGHVPMATFRWPLALPPTTVGEGFACAAVPSAWSNYKASETCTCAAEAFGCFPFGPPPVLPPSRWPV